MENICLIASCGVYFIAAVVLHTVLAIFIRKASLNNSADVDNADLLQEHALELYTGLKEKTEVLINQFYIAKSLKANFRKVGTAFYENYFVFSFCSIVYTILSSAFVFFVSIKGWMDSSAITQALAIETIILASFYYFLPKVLNNKANLKKNAEDMKSLQKIQFDILSFLNTYTLRNETETNAFIEKVYELLAVRYGYNIDIDPTSIDKNPLDSFSSFKSKKG